MTDQGYSVFWDEPAETTGRIILQHRYFTTKVGADDFVKTLPESYKPRLFERPHTPDQQRETNKRDDTEALNRRRLVELMLQHNITIPGREIDQWRPTKETSGRIEGVIDGITCIMTNGLLGYFLRADRGPFWGHVTHFIWDTPVKTTVTIVDEDTDEEHKVEITTKKGAPPPWATMPNEGKAKKVKKLTPKAKKALKRAQIIANL
jgi:hypothetical protein